MKIIKNLAWIYYENEVKNNTLVENKRGKWMYFYSIKTEESFLDSICKSAIEENAIVCCKRTNPSAYGLNPNAKDGGQGVICFYLNGDDIENHKRIISFMLKNKLIAKTKTGKLYNISFKYDDQTRARQYGNDFSAQIKLSDFVDLTTGEFIK